MTALIAQLDAAGLTGRGGAAFSTAVKVAAAAEHGATLIVNVCDGEIGAAKDGWVVAHHLPELVRGAELVTGGRPGAVRYAAHRGSVTARTLASAGLPVLEAPARYVSSEESSLISLLHGGLARPMTKRAPFVFGGADPAGKPISPTVVLNAETVWRVAQVAGQGPQWFRSFGTAAEPGPRLVTISGHGVTDTVVQTQAGVRLTELLDAAGGLAPDATALLCGGLGGIVLAPQEVEWLRFETADLARFHGSTGPGVLRVLGPQPTLASQLAGLVRFGADESAGQCGPCMFGLPALADAFDAYLARPSTRSRDLVLARAGLLPGRGACGHPSGVARFAASALRVLDHAATLSTGGHHG